MKTQIDNIEFYVLDNKNELGLSISEIASLCGVSHQSVSKIINTQYSKVKFKILGNYHSKIISQNIAKEIIKYYISKGKYTEKGIKFVEFKLSKLTLLNNKEDEIRNLLYEKLGGKKEVFTDVGRIDLLTSEELIEVKNVNNWKGALGQVLVYSKYYPSHQKRIHLFGKTTSKLQKLIETNCNMFDIKVTWEIV